MARLNFVIPSLPTKPVGGVKVMFQLANRFSERGYDVTIYYSIRRPFKNQRTPVWLRWIISRLRMGTVAKWFVLYPSIKQRVVPSITDAYVRDADATICTWWQMAYAINDLHASKGLKCNFIQDHELWTGQNDRVHQSYRLPLKHVVIATYLQDVVEKYSGVRPPLVNISIDNSRFALTIPVAERRPASLIMMYSEEPRKGSNYGLAALELVKQRIPELRVTLFSVYERPSTIPAWMEFTKRPANLPQLFNQHAIFCSPSLGEGWALPPAEAMGSGCAVVCTNIGGHKDYAIDGETALLFPPENAEAMADCIYRIINDHQLRERLAAAGHKLIHTEFTWDHAVDRLECILLGKAL